MRANVRFIVPALAISGIIGTPRVSAQDAPLPPLVAAGAQATLDEIANAAGGTARGGRFLGKLETFAQFDGTALGADWLGARADVGLMNGRRVSSALVGDIQGVDNIEGVRAFRVYNAWVSARGDLVSAEAGVIDLNSQFDIHNVSALFLNSSFGTGPSLSHSGLNGPSIYPNSGLGVVAWTDALGDDVRVRVGAFDGVPNDPDSPARTTLRVSRREGALLIGEVDKTWGRRGRIAVGVWGYTAKQPRLRDPDVSERGSVGGFVTLEGTLVRLADGRRLDGWARAGVADATFNVVSSYVGGGAVLHGVSGRGATDALGLGLAHADLSPGQDVESGAVAGASTTGSGTETTVELSYQRPVRGWLAVQPDVQYVVSPAGRRDLKNALVLGLRFILAVGD